MAEQGGQEDTSEIAEQHIITVKALLLQHYPFYGGLLSTLKFKQYKVGNKNFRASTDGYSTIFYNPEEIRGMNKLELTVTLAHEVGHISFKHVLREGGRDHRLFNIAADYVVNAILLEDGIGNVELFRNMKLLYNEQFKGMSVEQVYDIIKKDPYTYLQQVGFPINHETWGISNNTTETERDNDSGLVVEEWNGLTESQKQKIDSEINNKIAQAISIEKQMRGNISSRIARDFIKKLEEPRVDWRQLLAQYLEETSTNNTYRRFNKKYLPMDILLPTPNIERASINVMLDVSGSISDELLRQFISDVYYLLSTQDTYEEVNVYQVDTKVLSHIKIAVGDDLGEVTGKIFTRNGSGGTDFTSFFKYLTVNNNQNITIVFTDGDATIPDKEPNFPVIFIYTRHELEWGINILYNTERER